MTTGQILDFFRANNLSIEFYGSEKKPLFLVFSNVTRRIILDLVNETQLKNFYQSLNKSGLMETIILQEHPTIPIDGLQFILTGEFLVVGRLDATDYKVVKDDNGVYIIKF